jgi:hypothetical protein
MSLHLYCSSPFIYVGCTVQHSTSCVFPWLDVKWHCLYNSGARALAYQDVLVTRTEVKTLYQQQTPHLRVQCNTQTHLDKWHLTLGYNIQFKHQIVERFQFKVLRLIVDASWYVSNSVICQNLQIPTLKEEISRFSCQSTGACADTGHTTCFSNSNNLH